MTYLLDANAWIGHLRQNSPEVTRRLGQHPSTEVVLCSVVLGELLYEVERSVAPKQAANRALVAALCSNTVRSPLMIGPPRLTLEAEPIWRLWAR